MTHALATVAPNGVDASVYENELERLKRNMNSRVTTGLMDLNNRVVVGGYGFRKWQDDLTKFNLFINHLAMITRKEFNSRDKKFSGDLNPPFFASINKYFSPENTHPSAVFKNGIELDRDLVVPKHWKPRTSKPKPNIFTDPQEIIDEKLSCWKRESLEGWEIRRPPAFMESGTIQEVWDKTIEECKDPSFLVGPFDREKIASLGVTKASGRFGVIQGEH